MATDSGAQKHICVECVNTGKERKGTDQGGEVGGRDLARSGLAAWAFPCACILCSTLELSLHSLTPGTTVGPQALVFCLFRVASIPGEAASPRGAWLQAPPELAAPEGAPHLLAGSLSRAGLRLPGGREPPGRRASCVSRPWIPPALPPGAFVQQQVHRESVLFLKMT